MLVEIGVGLAAGSAALLASIALRAPAAAPFPGYGWWGLGAMAGLEALLALRTPGVTAFFTALIWTAYIAAADAAVFRLRGESLLRQGRAFAAMALLSVPIWVIFEIYNLRLRNWDYVGVPGRFWLFALGAGWAFATILPGIFETADLLHCAWASRLRWRPWETSGWPWMAAGAACLVAPLLAPVRWAPLLFAPVWIGFALLLEPVNRDRGWPSLLLELERGRPGRLLALLASGAICGFFWEFWNYWAGARWEYIFPILHRDRIFAMPAPGFLGFPPFALECFALYVFLAHALLPEEWRARLW
ncbi:MAG: hypothetical protein ACRD1E_06190 [Terriglobales bacterium]